MRLCVRVPVRAATVPLPGRADNGEYVRVLERPSESGLDLRRVGDKGRGIARAARHYAPGHGLTDHRLARLDHLHNGVTRSGAEVVDLRGALVGRADGPPVGVGEVAGVDVVADAGAVGRRVVGAEDVDVGPLAQRYLEHKRDQVGLGAVVLAVRAVGLGAG